MLQKSEFELDYENEEQKIPSTEKFFQIDVLKAIMIFLVIFDHTIPWTIKDNLGVALWERISIPVFMVIMGFNIGKSLQREKIRKKLSPIYYEDESFYSSGYFWKKLIRYGIPYVILYIISTNVGALFYGPDVELIKAGQWARLYGPNFDDRHLYIGILPFWGPGNWFLPVIFSFIILAPWLYRGFSGKKWKAIASLLLCYVVEIIIQLIVFSLKDPNPSSYVYPSLDAYYTALLLIYNVLILLSAVGLGMWFSRDHDLFSKQNIFMWILFPLSLIYLIAYQFFDFRVLLNDVPFLTGDYNLLVFPYSAFLVLIALKVLPENSKTKLASAIKIISKSTYHILLTQILYFGIVYALYGDHYGASIFGISYTDDALIFLSLIINWLICVPTGIIWWYIGTRIKTAIRAHIEIEQL